jgi:lysozyme
MRRTLLALVAALMLLGAGAQGATAWTNGDAPSSAMTPIATGVKCPPLQGQLDNRAAAAWNSMALAAGEVLAINGCDSAYRPLARQIYWKAYWCGQGHCENAATPGFSNHGWGVATDDPPRTIEYLHDHGDRFRWGKTEAMWEPWHWNYVGGYNRPNPGTNLHSPTLRQGSGGPGQNVYVRKLQKLLRGHGDKSVDVDGEYGHSTTVAVERFQHAEYLKVNGVVSKRVWKRLRRPATKPIKTTPKKVPPVVAPAAPAAHPDKPKPKKHHHKKRPKGPAWGIDVSSNNGSIDFGAVRHAGASFACVKASEGQDYIDHGFGRKKMRAVTGAGLVPCAYHFLRPRGDRVGAREAAWFTQVIGHAGYGKGWLPPVLDVETTELGPAETCRYVGSFLRLVRRNLGVKAIVYTYPSFAQANFSGCSWLGKYRLWIAHYGVSSPTIPNPPWSTNLIWQYSSTSHVAGVNGDVDVNKLTGGRAALVDLRVKQLPKRARKAPRAKVDLPLALDSSVKQGSPATVAVQEQLGLAPAPEGAATTDRNPTKGSP